MDKPKNTNTDPYVAINNGWNKEEIVLAKFFIVFILKEFNKTNERFSFYSIKLTVIASADFVSDKLLLSYVR